MVEDDGSGGASVQLPEQEVEGDRGGVMGHGGGASRLGSPIRHHYLPIDDVAKVHSEIYLYRYPTLTKSVVGF